MLWWARSLGQVAAYDRDEIRIGRKKPSLTLVLTWEISDRKSMVHIVCVPSDSGHLHDQRCLKRYQLRMHLRDQIVPPYDKSR